MTKYSLLAGVAAAAMAANAASAQEFNLRLAHWVPPSHPIQELGIEPWIESLVEASDGRIGVTIFPAQQLGAAPDHYDMTRDGVTDIGYVNPGYQAGRFPVYSLLEVPFHMDNAVRGAQAFHEWYEPIAETEMADVMFCLANPHDPGTIHSKSPILEPGDIRGLNVRPAHATMARFISRLGGGPVQVPAPEAREAIANGTADAITFPWNSIWIFGIDSQTKQHLDMPFYASGQMLLINWDTYNSMPEDLQQVVDDHCTPEWSARFSEGWAENEASGRDKALEDPTHTVNVPTDEQVQMWRDAAAPMIDQWKADAAAAGYDAEGLYDAYIEKLDEYDARF